MSHVIGATDCLKSYHTYVWVMSHVWMSHVTCMNESRLMECVACHTYEWVMRVTPTNESCVAWRRISSRIRIRISHVTHEWDMSHVWMSHVSQDVCCQGEIVVAHMNESCHTYEWVMSHIRMSHVVHMIESLSHVTQNAYRREVILVVHINESRHTRINESRHTEYIPRRRVVHICMSHGTHMNESCHTYEWGTSHRTRRAEKNPWSHRWMSHGTHMNGSCHTYGWVTSRRMCRAEDASLACQPSPPTNA